MDETSETIIFNHHVEVETPATVRRSGREVKFEIFEDYVTYMCADTKLILGRQVMLEEIKSLEENQA